MMPQKHTPLQSFPFDIRTVEKRCSYVNTISINLALIKQKRNSDVANILDTYVKNRHLFANFAPWAGNVSDDEKSGNFPPAPRKPADPARAILVAPQNSVPSRRPANGSSPPPSHKKRTTLGHPP